MEMLDYKLEYSDLSAADEKGIPVIIVAAGSSTRMGGINKQFTTLAGVPTIVHTMLAFQRSARISRIIVVTKKENIADIEKLARDYMITKLSEVVEGGATRQESVYNGLMCAKNDNYVLIHDGARPLVTDEIIGRVCDGLEMADCVVCGVNVTDTVKYVNDERYAEKTIDRSHLVSVQTPQGVDVKKYLEIMKSTDYTAVTDDASVFELGGMSVLCVEGDRSNIKITTKDDIMLAEFYLSQRGEM